MKADKDVSFTNYPGLEGTNSSRKNINISKEWNTYVFEGTPEDKWIDNGRHAFVLYGPSEKDFTLSIGDFNIQFDTDVELFAHWTKNNYSTGTVLNIEGFQYIVIEQKDNDKYLVIRKESIGNKNFQSTPRADGQNQNTYEGSKIDNYLENNWYNSLSSTMKAAIQTTSIKQASYATYNDPDSKQETGYNDQVYNTIDRHVFLPSVSEIGKVVDLKNPDKVKAFLNGTYLWTRDSSLGDAHDAEYLSANNGSLDSSYVLARNGVRPVFVIDLSKVNYTVTGTVNYK